MVHRLVIGYLVLAAASAAAGAEPSGDPDGAPSAAERHSDHEAAFSLGGYLQPRFRLRQDDDAAQFDEDGFGLGRVRLVGGGGQTIDGVRFGLALEAEMTPSPELLDAYATARVALPADGDLELAAGQLKAPWSRQAMMSDSELGLPDKAELVALAPDRQLGIRFAAVVPWATMVEVSAGAFDGEGRNQVDNVDQHYLWVGRVAVRPLGRDQPVGETPTERPTVSFGLSVARNLRTTGDTQERRRTFGADVFASAFGAALYAEYIAASTRYPADAPLPNSTGNGVNVQLLYSVPLPLRSGRRLEIGARFEEIDRNDTIPIEMAGDPNQSRRSYAAVVGYYHRGHDLKAQVSASHVVEVETLNVRGESARYDNDTILAQLTYRVR